MRKLWQISYPFYPLVDSRSILGSLSFLPICTIWRAHISTFAPMMMVMIYRFPKKKKFVDENIWAKTNNNSQVDGDEIMKEEDNSDISEMMMMMVGTMSGGGWLRLSPVGKHLELTHWGGIIRICPAPYIIMDCRPTKKYCKKCCLFPRNCLSELRLNIILSFMSRFCHLYHFCNFCIMLRWVTQSVSQ